MDKSVLLEKANALDGISLADWKHLKLIVDESFQKKERELETALKLSCAEDVKAAIQSLLG